MDTQNNFIDIDLSVTARQRFRINGDNDKILELNTSDMGIIHRLNEVDAKMKSLANKASEIQAIKIVNEESDEDVNVEEIAKFGEQIHEMNNELKQYLDYAFDSNVSEVCCNDGTLFDIFNGKFRYEHVIEKLMNLYVQNIQSEYKKMIKRVQSHTSKYTKKRRK